MENRELKPCPFAEKTKSITGKIEFDCDDCPALVCPYPQIKEEWKEHYGIGIKCRND